MAPRTASARTKVPGGMLARSGITMIGMVLVDGLN
jgi:hypothetical protein